MGSPFTPTPTSLDPRQPQRRGSTLLSSSSGLAVLACSSPQPVPELEMWFLEQLGSPQPAHEAIPEAFRSRFPSPKQLVQAAHDLTVATEFCSLPCHCTLRLSSTLQWRSSERQPSRHVLASWDAVWPTHLSATLDNLLSWP